METRRPRTIEPTADLEALKKLIAQGEEHHARGDRNSARLCFVKALEIAPENVDALNNLGVIAFQAGDIKEAEQLFFKALQLEPDNAECLDNLATIRSPVTSPAARLCPSPTPLQGAKVAIVNTWDNGFNRLYREHLSKANDVRLVIPRTPADLDQAAAWADVIWTAWANEPLAYLSRLRKRAAIVTHLRSYEILSPELMTGIHWENVEGIIFVAAHIRELAKAMWPHQIGAKQQTVVHNCVELERCPLYHQKPGFNIAYVGYLNHKKGVELLLQCVAAAARISKSYRLHIAGEFQEKRFEVYAQHLLAEMGLTDQVVFRGWVKDVPAFLAEMNFVISTSPWEGCPNNIIEAMACGVKPLIHNWKGARELFGAGLVFDTIDQFVSLLTSDKYNSESYRAQVAEKFNAAVNLPQIDSFLAQFYGKSNATHTVAAPVADATTDQGGPQAPACAATNTDIINYRQSLPAGVGYVDDRKRFTVDFCRGKRVLHVGCVDTGIMSRRRTEGTLLHELIARAATCVIGVDINDEGLAILRQEGHEVYHLDLETDRERLAELAARVDVIVVPEVLEHLSNPGRALDNLAACGFGGDIMITTPNAFSYRTNQVLRENVELVHPDHTCWFSSNTIRTLLTRHGFEIRRMLMYYYPGDDPIGQQQFRLMKECPYYGDGLILLVRRSNKSM